MAGSIWAWWKGIRLVFRHQTSRTSINGDKAICGRHPRYSGRMYTAFRCRSVVKLLALLVGSREDHDAGGTR